MKLTFDGLEVQAAVTRLEGAEGETLETVLMNIDEAITFNSTSKMFKRKSPDKSVGAVDDRRQKVGASKMGSKGSNLPETEVAQQPRLRQ